MSLGSWHGRSACSWCSSLLPYRQTTRRLGNATRQRCWPALCRLPGHHVATGRSPALLTACGRRLPGHEQPLPSSSKGVSNKGRMTRKPNIQ